LAVKIDFNINAIYLRQQKYTMVYITRKEHFNAAHKVHRAEWSLQKNTEVFGKCANPNWHGHNYNLYVTVKGKPNPETGFVVDLKALSVLIREQITEVLDHKNLNEDDTFMKGLIPTTEHMSIEIWKHLQAPIIAMGAHLHCIKLYETENNYVEYFGEE
jgi:6-pyruvoyltetrahydropterin/6-carboxytetrahydropterin synthase